MKQWSSLHPAKLSWRQGVPYSDVYDDLYFAREGGLEESRYVFLENNNLPNRWKDCTQFTIAETGFGTGLNFLSTLALWCESAPACTQLHYISAEKHPFAKIDLSLALKIWPHLSRYSKELLKVYPELVPGFHRRELANRRVTLTLLFGDALELFTQVRAEVDAWYLDGFAPGKNPQMWMPKLFQQMARLSHAGTTFSTFTAAGAVRRGLQEVGFEVSKFPGFGAKRDMLRGVMHTTAQSEPAVDHLSETPWYDVPAQSYQTGTNAIVVGAGLAGISAAHALAKRNWTVTVFEQHSHFAQEASGNLAGIAMPRLTADMSAEGRLYLAAFLHSIYLYNSLKETYPDFTWHADGVLHLIGQQSARKLIELDLPASVVQYVNKDTARKLCSFVTANDGVFYPLGGWLNPRDCCRVMVEDQKHAIKLHFNTPVSKIFYQDGLWHLTDRGGNSLGQAAVIILANGYETLRFDHCGSLQLQHVRGQVTYLPSTEQSSLLPRPVCYDGYITPNYQGHHSVGATYDWHNNSSELTSQDHDSNLSALYKNIPAMVKPAKKQLNGRVAFRTTTLDHLPVIGPLMDEHFYSSNYENLKHGKPKKLFPPGQYIPGAYISTGHGSRGLISCYLAADIIGAYLNREPQVLPMDLLNSVHPARFLIRKLKRG